MKVFISWSGARSKMVALALREFLPLVLCDSVEPWMSDKDIDAGRMWATDLARALGESGFGVICVTRDNAREPWLHFESGALLKKFDEASVCPFLLDVNHTELGPLTQFQAKQFDHQGTHDLVRQINQACNLNKVPTTDEVIARRFEKFWPDLEKSRTDALALNPTSTPAREMSEVVQEMAIRLSNIERSLARIAARNTSEDQFAEISTEDLFRAFTTIPDFGPQAIRAEQDKCLYWLRSNGVRNSDELYELVGRHDILNWLRNTYRTELLRSGEHPLDPVAVATWGAALYRANMSKHTQDRILSLIRTSPEYHAAHSNK